MRLFIAINLTSDIKDYLMAAIQELKKEAFKGNFTRRENLHLTLVFLGELSEEKTGIIKSAMDRINGEPFLLSISGFGKFKRNSGDIHWAGVDKSEALIMIQKQLIAELEKTGFSLENREFAPHLTLGREVRLADPSGNIYESLPTAKQEMNVSRISLMKSERINEKLIYSEIYGREL
ncbi:MAG TPA: RNA 2',3'-cyclic phosphodiesterase [Anaerovoracaceae bacterium]|nr:RNA 2',3'-cyclic phosphodiesterase [Anaerovoracaceae bacterium]